MSATADPTDIFTRSSPPWWLEALYKLGLPTVLCLVLVGFLLRNVNKQMGDLQATMNLQTAILNQHVMDGRVDQFETRWYLRALCFNSAETDTQRASCVPPQERPR